MTPHQLRATLKRIGISQMEAGRVLGTTGRTVRLWIAGDSRIPTAAAIILRLLDTKQLSLEHLRAMTAKEKPHA